MKCFEDSNLIKKEDLSEENKQALEKIKPEVDVKLMKTPALDNLKGKLSSIKSTQISWEEKIGKIPKCFMYGIIDTGPEVPLGKIKIQINNNHLTSMISRQIADFLKPNCYTSKTDVSLSILIPKIDGIFKIQWQFRISDEPQVHNSWFDILLGSDFLSDDASPIHSSMYDENVLALLFKNGIIHQFPINYKQES